MFGRKSVIGIAVLCALALSALTAANAAAEQRAFTCAPTGTGFSDAHCTSPSGAGKFSHVAIETGVETEISGTNEKTASETTAAAVSKLKGALSGVETEIQCTVIDVHGILTNTPTSLHFLPILITYTTCSVTKPAGKGCKVSGGEVKTKELTATTVGQAENNVKVTPLEGTEFASIKIEGCSNEALNNTFPVTGSVTVTANGATASTTHTGVTAQNTLKFGGVKAGLEGAATISRKEGNPITLT